MKVNTLNGTFLIGRPVVLGSPWPAVTCIDVFFTTVADAPGSQSEPLAWPATGVESTGEHVCSPAQGVRANLLEPVRHRGNSAEVFLYVLLANESCWQYPAGRERNRSAKEGFQHENAVVMVLQHPMPEGSHVALGAVHTWHARSDA